VVVDALAEAVESRIQVLEEAPLAAIEAVLRARPMLAARREIWLCSGRLREAALRTLAPRLAWDSGLAKATVGAMVEADAQTMVMSVVEFVGADLVVRAILARAASHPTMSLGCEWRKLLASALSVDAALSWLREVAVPSDVALEIMHVAISPLTYGVRQEGIDTWLRVLRGSNANEMSAEAAAFFCAVGLRRSEDGAAELLGACCSRVYTALARKAIEERAWLWLVDEIPRYPDWDKCRRLVEGVLEKFAEHAWATQELSRALCAPGAFAQAVESVDSEYSVSRKARRVLHRLVEDIDHGDIGATDEQRRAVRRE
jgi:hypothetical protein